jgi:hypothetical protein
MYFARETTPNLVCALMELHVSWNGSLLLTFRDNLFAPSTRVKQSKYSWTIAANFCVGGILQSHYITTVHKFDNVTLSEFLKSADKLFSFSNAITGSEQLLQMTLCD